MSTVFFGTRWDAPIVDPPALQADTPVGEPCSRCGEEIAEGEQGLLRVYVEAPGTVSVQPVHRECDMVGIVGHLVGVCSCTGWDTSTRATAREVLARFEAGASRS